MRAAFAGEVDVNGIRGRIEAGETRRLTGVGAPPYTVTLRADHDLLTVVEAPGPFVDLERLFGDPPLPGPRVPIWVRGVPAGMSQVSVIAGGRRFAGERVDGAWRIRPPATGPAELVAAWEVDGRVVGLARLPISDPAAAAGTTLAIGPTIPVDAAVLVQMSGAPAGWLEVELTLGGVRSGVILGAGVAEPREAVRVPRPGALAGAGLWLSARARDVGAHPTGEPAMATTAAHVPLDTDAAALSWGPSPEVRPLPTDGAGAPLLQRSRPSLRWSPDLAEADWVHVELDARDGCAAPLRWRVIAPAAAGALYLPPVQPDPLDRPLLMGRVSVHRWAGAEYAAFLADGPSPSERLPRHTERSWQRAVAGVWRAGPETCPADPNAGRYLYRPPAGRCQADTPATEIVVSRCGAVVPIGPLDLCGADGGDLQRADGGLRLGNARLDPAPGAAQRAPSQLLGPWLRLVVESQEREEVDGGPGPARSPPIRLVTGDPAGGPWAEFAPDGRFALETSRFSLRGGLTAFDGVEGRIEADPSECPGERADVRFTLADGGLQMDVWRPDGRGAGTLFVVTLARR